ncbi:heme ABC transporter ATP-binding protein [Alteraurantiacibacter aestuarii]|uniref:ATP-binding cassette domain-containing protein n=1 Tax=Alteraurantiacibacter aestuarii TaxID=650004 RepID=A0A844ZQ89_9SPHN|nr:ABC transporter ATP-binding protein [Alteraurantiacibacter aestuarii]MXO87779.1 ATP-binding cassette domain-containing protein [Alteraurantiacibacter aestuarii]
MLEVQDLCVELGGASVLRGITATFRPGTVTAICGPNGAGKSTLLAALAGLLPAASGKVLLDGEALSAIPARQRARAIGYLPQAGEVAWNLSVEALATLGRLPHGDSDIQAVHAALEATGMAGFAQRPIATLSGGEKARALLARVLASGPRWILADEPLAALDLGHQLAMLRHLRSAAQGGVGVVLVLHDLPLAMNHADHVLVLDGGALHASGPPEVALSPDTIGQVWKTRARWLGEPGTRALSIS